jgi:hypothetical protein
MLWTDSLRMKVKSSFHFHLTHDFNYSSLFIQDLYDISKIFTCSRQLTQEKGTFAHKIADISWISNKTHLSLVLFSQSTTTQAESQKADERERTESSGFSFLLLFFNPHKRTKQKMSFRSTHPLKHACSHNTLFELKIQPPTYT